MFHPHNERLRKLKLQKKLFELECAKDEYMKNFERKQRALQANIELIEKELKLFKEGYIK